MTRVFDIPGTNEKAFW